MFKLQSIASSSRIHRVIEEIRAWHAAGGALLASIALGSPAIARAGVAPPNYVLTDLGTLPGFGSSVAKAINSAGEVVGSSWPDGGTQTQAFLYAGGSMRAIAGAGTNSVATGINSSGTVVGYSPAGAFIYTGGAAQPLAGMARAVGINDSGEIVGAAQAPGFTSSYPATDTNGVVQRVGPTGSAYYYAATAINSMGAVLWHGTTAPVDMAQVYVNGTSQGTGLIVGDAINDSGEIVGLGATGLGYRGLPYHAFVTTVGSFPIQDLGTLGGDYSEALGINNLGQIVGDSGIVVGDASTHGFLDLNGTMYDLNGLTTGDTGYVITSAVAINGGGQIAADAVTPSGEEHAVLLTPAAIPLPPAAWMGLGTMDLLICGMICRQRRAGTRVH
ncbi:MAG TPA: hypothetical protein VGI81_25535 [Tepidisphaeraceae bacterium]|jgi:probable HAF family extracellular repeat protein